MQETHARVLLVEDDDGDAVLVRMALESAPGRFTHVRCRTVAEAIATSEGTGFDVILLDLSLPDAFGVEAVEMLSLAQSDVPVIALTGADDPQLLEDAFRGGVQDYLNKNELEPRLLSRTISHAVQRQRLKVRLELHAHRSREQEVALRRILDDLADAVIVQAEGRRPLFANVVARDTFGPDAASVPLQLPSDGDAVELPTAAGQMRRFEVRSTRTVWKGDAATVLSLRDVTDLDRARTLELQLIEADRLASIGRIAGGIAHEINNPAALVTANLELVRDSLHRAAHEADPGVDAMLDECSAAIQRIGAVVDELQATASVSDAERTSVNLNDVVESACSLLRSPLRHQCTLVKRLDPLPPIIGRRSELVQMVTAVLTDMLARAEFVTVAVRTICRDDEVSMVFETDVSEVMGRTTVEQTRAARRFADWGGLSLAMAHEIARAHDGWIRPLPHAPTRGLELGFPVPGHAGIPRAIPTDPTPSGHAVRPRVLLVDDEVELLTAYGRLLSREFEVTTATNGLEALTRIEECDLPFDAIVCDLMMPELDGRGFFRRLEALGLPTHNILFATGGAFAEASRRFLATVDNTVLHKPFSGSDLRRAIRSVVDAAGFPAVVH